MSLEGKVALVTGAGKGIGRAISLSLADEGANLSLVSRTESDLVSLKNEIEARGRTASYFVCDVTKPNEVEKVVSETCDKYGQINILVNNAGIFMLKDFKDSSYDDFFKIVNTNLNGAFYFTRNSIDKGVEYIIDVLSHASYKSFSGDSAYGASKAAHMMMSRCIELENPEINFSRVYPGPVDTPLWGRSEGASDLDIPSRTMITSQDVADLITDMIYNKTESNDMEIMNEDGNVVRKSVSFPL